MKRLISESTREGVLMSIASDVVDKYNAFVGGAAVILSAILGQYWILFLFYLLFNVLDVVTGTYRSRKLQIESSEAGHEGIKKKVIGWVLVVVGFAIPAFIIQFMEIFTVDISESYIHLIGWFVLAALMVNEVRSILENLVECGYQIPAFLTKGLAVASKLIDKKAESILPDETED